MLFQTIMSYWAILILVIGAVCVVSIFARTRTNKDSQTPVKTLFDFSGGQQEGRQMQKKHWEKPWRKQRRMPKLSRVSSVLSRLPLVLKRNPPGPGWDVR